MPGDFCGESFQLEIFLITDQVETEVRNLYRKIVSLQSDGASEGPGQQYRDTLVLYAKLRTDLDLVLRKLSPLAGTGDIQEVKRTVLAGLTLTSKRLTRAAQHCSQDCSSAACQSCGLAVIQSVRDLVATFNRKYNNQGPAQHIKEDQRTGLLNLVGVYNELSREIFKKNSLEEKVEDCDRQKAKVWEKLQ